MDPTTPMDLSKIEAYAQNYGVPEMTIMDIKKAFDIIDTNKNGSIQPQEFESILQELGLYDQTGITTKSILAELDTNQSGVIDFDEFLDFSLRRVDEKAEKAEIDKVFNYYDEDMKGKIDGKDLGRIAGVLGQKMSEDEVKKMLNLLDFDGDGFVEKEDFYNMMMGKIVN